MIKLIWLIPSLLLLLLISGCGKKVSPEKNYNNRSSAVNESIRKEEVTVTSTSSKNVDIITKNHKAEKRKLALLESKLRKCDIKYEPWQDRLEKDFILMPKLINICRNLKGSTKIYTIHSTKKERSNSFTLKDHLFIPYNWNSQQIEGYLNKAILGAVTKRVRVESIDRNKLKKQSISRQYSIPAVSVQKSVDTTDYEVVEAEKQLRVTRTGNPY
jgi:hypothetical protein